MKKIVIAGAGGAPSEGVILSLIRAGGGEEIIGMGSEVFDLALSSAHKKYHVPYCYDAAYESALLKLLSKEKPDLIHFQNDAEVYSASLLREKILAAGVKLYMPTHNVIETCINKHKSYEVWKAHGIKVPENILIHNVDDLARAFENLGDANGMIWLRVVTTGAGGKGALPTNDFEFAKRWIDHFKGWGEFAAAQMLTSDTVTWLSIWFEGELVVAQTRKRKGWTHGNRTLSGVTGVTKTGETYSSETVDRIALDTIRSIDTKPHGIYGVDMTYSKEGIPNPTEINISRFFTTILFFTEAGLNMPEIFKDIILYNKFPLLDKKINPLPDGLLWCRGMDKTPRLTTENELSKEILIA